MSSSSKMSSQSLKDTCLSSSSKRVTWGKSSTFKEPLFASTKRKVHITVDSLKRKIKHSVSRDESDHNSKRQVVTPYKSLHGILKLPTHHFPEYCIDLDFDFEWAESTQELSVDHPEEFRLPALTISMDTEDTPTSSALSTPPETSLAYDRWKAESSYLSDQWDTTPKPVSGWEFPPFYDHETSTRQPLVVSRPFQIDGAPQTPTETVRSHCEPFQIRKQPISTPNEFLDDLASSLQHTLVVCGIGLIALLFLFLWTTLLLTCGMIVASVVPVVFVAYWIIYFTSSARHPAEWIALTAIKIGGSFSLVIGFTLVIFVDLVLDEIECLCILGIRFCPVVISISVLTALFCTLSGISTNDLFAYCIELFLSF